MDSTESALVHMTGTMLQDRNDGNIAGYAFSKAFELVDHTLLLPQTFKHYKINNLSPPWFESYLSNRSQQVNIHTNLLNTEHILCGAPQGSIYVLCYFVIFYK